MMHHEPVMTPADAPATAPGLLWTTDAAEAIRRLRAEEGRPDAPFRVDVRLGGCQGFKVYFELDAENPDDVSFDAAGDVRIVVQEEGLPMIAGGILDYEDSHRGRGFRMANPQAEKACGCGQAFYANFEQEQDELDPLRLS
jgi:iron-sulfur cluster insertion protein